MKATNFLITALAAFAFATLASCDDNDGDTTKPVIVLNEPEDEEVFALGGTLHLEMELSDNDALDEYKVEIHLAAGHTHTRADEPASIYTNTWNDASGLRNKHVHQDIVIPSDAAPGEYHVMVYCTDISGNEAHVVRTIDIDTEGGEPHDHDH